MNLIPLAIFALSIFAVNEAFAEPIENLPIIDSLIANSDGTHTLTWSAPTSDDYDIIDYDIRYAESFRYFWLENLSTDKTTIVISNLDTTKKYQFVVYAWTENYSFASPFFYVIPAEPPVPTVDPVPTVTPTIKPITQPVTQSKGNGGCSDCTPPTPGVDSTGKRFVTGGIEINGHAEDAGYFHTYYPMQFTNIGEINNIELTFYENSGIQNIKLVQLGIGVKEIGTSINDSQARIEVWMDDFAGDIENPLIKEVRIIDKDGIIGNESGKVSLVECGDSTCLKVSFSYTYDKIPESWILQGNAIDYNRNTFNNYFNDGLTVIDPTPEPEIVITPYEYTCNDPVQKVMTRYHCTFGDLKTFEANRALESLK